MRLSLLAIFTALAMTGSVVAWLAAPAKFTVDLCSGEPTHGELVRLADDWRVVLATPAPVELTPTKFFRLRQAKVTAPVPTGPQVILANGDRIRGTVLHLDEEAAVVASELLGRVRIPLDVIAAILLEPLRDEMTAFRMARRLLEHKPSTDELWFRNGDRLRGTLLAMDDRSVHVQVGDDEVAVPQRRVAAIVVNRELVVVPELEGVHGVVVLTDGTEVHVRSLRMEGAVVRAQAAFDAELAFAVDRIAVCEILGGCATFLSELEPRRYEHVPYLGATRYELTRDRSIWNRRLSLRGQVFRRGVAMHSRSEATYALDGGFERFRSWVGIDDETNGGGSAIAYVRVDGEERFRSPMLTGTSPPVLVEVDLRGAAELTLGVDYGERGDVLDHVDWADAVLIRKPAEE